MLKRPRLTVRHWMLVVAVVAFAVVVWNELYYRRRRDICARIETWHAEAAMHEESERDFCVAHQSTLYDKNDREAHHATYGWPEYRDWLDEANQHAKWAETYRKSAQEAAERRQSLQQHLIFP